MRNLVEYPVTKQEIVECLDRLIMERRERRDDLIGDMTPVLLEVAKRIVQASRDLPSGSH